MMLLPGLRGSPRHSMPPDPVAPRARYHPSMVTEIRPDGVSLLDAVAFLAELLLLAVLAIAGWRLGGSQPWQIVLAVAMPLALACGWGLWLAPNAVMRLRFPLRLIVKVDVFI